MKVKDLKEILKDWDDNKEVWLSSDEEGNRYHTLNKFFASIPEEPKYGRTDSMIDIEINSDGEYTDKDIVLVLSP